jgi:hypothetical protein
MSDSAIWHALVKILLLIDENRAFYNTICIWQSPLFRPIDRENLSPKRINIDL